MPTEQDDEREIANAVAWLTTKAAETDDVVQRLCLKKCAALIERLQAAEGRVGELEAAAQDLTKTALRASQTSDRFWDSHGKLERLVSEKYEDVKCKRPSCTWPECTCPALANPSQAGDKLP